MGGLWEGFGGKGGWGVKNFLPHPNELLIWAYPENLFKFRLMVNSGQQGTGQQGRAGHEM